MPNAKGVAFVVVLLQISKTVKKKIIKRRKNFNITVCVRRGVLTWKMPHNIEINKIQVEEII